MKKSSDDTSREALSLYTTAQKAVLCGGFALALMREVERTLQTLGLETNELAMKNIDNEMALNATQDIQVAWSTLRAVLAGTNEAEGLLASALNIDQMQDEAPETYWKLLKDAQDSVISALSNASLVPDKEAQKRDFDVGFTSPGSDEKN